MAMGAYLLSLLSPSSPDISSPSLSSTSSCMRWESSASLLSFSTEVSLDARLPKMDTVSEVLESTEWSVTLAEGPYLSLIVVRIVL